MPVNFRYATEADARLLAETGEQMFRETFGPLNDPAQMDLYCGTHFDEDIQRAELRDAASVMLIAEHSGELVGYAKIGLDSAPGLDGVAYTKPLEIHRFYVASSQHGSGLAGELMERCFAEGRARGCDAVWLAVWKENPRAIRFYAKLGFEVIGEQNFMLGTEEQYDWVMGRAL